MIFGVLTMVRVFYELVECMFKGGKGVIFANFFVLIILNFCLY